MQLVVPLLLALIHAATSFHAFPSYARQPRPSTRTHTQLNMVFDFFKKRSEEGIAQVQNIAKKTAQGKLGEALGESVEYLRTRQKIDSENLRKLTDGLARSRERLLGGIAGAFDENKDIKNRLEALEDVLLQADIGATTTNGIIADLRQYAKSESLQEGDILPVLRQRLVEALQPPPGTSSGLLFSNTSEPTVIFVIGANGMGKTTTIGKIASRLRNEENATVLLGACDTFRAAAVEQLEAWAVRANVSIEVPTAAERGGDPVPVVTRSLRRAKAENFDVVIIDTSGRLSNNFELTEQLQRMKEAIVAENPAAPHETLLVVDGSLGRNAVDQAAAWRKYVGVSGLAITKLDGTARGGFVVSVVRDLGLPVKFIGVGEKISDLRDFQAEVFVDALLGNNPQQTEALKQRAERILNVSGANSEGEVVSRQPDDAAARLRASFSQDQGGNQDGDGVISEADLKAGMDKPKRTKRPKPAAQKKKK